mgnify:FL=1
MQALHCQSPEIDTGKVNACTESYGRHSSSGVTTTVSISGLKQITTLLAPVMIAQSQSPMYTFHRSVRYLINKKIMAKNLW